MGEEATKTYIAVVDDDESLCRSLARLLRASGLHPVTYLSAEAFLDDANRPRFGCLVLDIQLGGMSGIELGERLADSGSTTPVIFLTAHDEAEALAQARYPHRAVLMRKSVPGNSLLAAIQRAIATSAEGTT